MNSEQIIFNQSAELKVINDMQQQLNDHKWLYKQRLKKATRLQSRLYRVEAQLKRLSETHDAYGQCLNQASELHLAFENEDAQCLVLLKEMSCLKVMRGKITHAKHHA